MKIGFPLSALTSANRENFVDFSDFFFVFSIRAYIGIVVDGILLNDDNFCYSSSLSFTSSSTSPLAAISLISAVT